VQRGVQVGSLGREDVDALVQVVIRGGLADRVVAGQLRQTGVIQKPAPHEHRLFEAAQAAGRGAGATSDALGAQQARQVQDRLLARGQGSRWM